MRTTMNSVTLLPRHGAKVALLFAAFAMAMSVAPISAQEKESTAEIRVRVMSYNIHHGEGTDGKIDLERIARVIREAKVDLVALQEVDNGCVRSGKVDQTAELARLTGMKGRFCKQIPFEGGEYGQALLSKHPISEPTIHWLPGEPERERRILAVASIEIADRKLLLCTTHLHHLNGEFRKRQAAEIDRLLKIERAPVLLAGDLNANPDSDVLAILKSSWTIPIGAEPVGAEKPLLTYPAEKPAKQIDYILAHPSDRWLLKEQSVHHEPLPSDHLPLIIEWVLR